MNTRNTGLPVCEILKEKPLQSNSQNLDLISLAEAKAISGYNQGHLGLLCRTGKLQGQKIGRSWVVSRQALLAFLEAKGMEPKVAQTAQVVPEAVPVFEPAQVAKPEPVVIESAPEVEPQPVLSVISLEPIPEVHPALQSVPTVSFGRVFAAVAAVVVFVLAASVVRLWQNSQGISDAPLSVLRVGGVQHDGEKDLSLQGGQPCVGRSNLDSTDAEAEIASSPTPRNDAVSSDCFVAEPPRNDEGGRSLSLRGSAKQSVFSDGDAPAAKVLGDSISLQPSAIDFSSLGISEYQLNQLIAQQLTNLASIGLLGLPTNSSNSSSSSISSTPSTSAPVISYIQPAPSQNFSGASLLSATDLSSTRFTTTTANITDTATIKTLSVTEHANVAGDLTVAGTVNATVNGTLQPNFTQGSIAFQGASGLTEDNAGLYYDNANNRLGLGTTTPLAVLDIRQQTNGQPIINAQRATNTAPTGNFITYKDATGNTLYSVDNSGNVTAAGIASSSALTVTATTTPQLRVQYNASNEWTSSTNATGTTTFAFNGTAPGAVFIPQSNSATAFEFQDADGNPVLSVDTLHGNVGVGVGTPQAALEVRSAGSHYLLVDPVGNKVVSLGDLDGNFDGNAIQLDMQHDWTDFGGFYNASGFGGFINRSARTLQWGDGGSGNQTVFTVNDAAQKFTFENGNVGIGTSAPSAPLHIVVGSTQSGLKLQRTAATAASYDLYIGSDGRLGVYDYAASQDRLRVDTNGQVTVGSQNQNAQLGVVNSNPATPALKLRAAAAQSSDLFTVTNSAGTQVGVRIRNDGILSVGTETTDTVYNGSSGMANIVGPSGYWGVRTSTANAFNVDVYNSGTPRAALTILQSGNVGIGTTSPSAKLEVLGSNTLGDPTIRISRVNGGATIAPYSKLELANQYVNSGDTVGGVEFVNNTAANTYGAIRSVSRSTYGAFTDADLQFYTLGSSSLASRMVIQGNGNVGIGTAAPTQKLDVNGNSIIGRVASAGALSYSLLYQENGTAYMGFQQRGSTNVSNVNMGGIAGLSELTTYNTGGLAVYTATAQPILLGTNNYERVRIDAAGNVGIGTTTPGTSLEVAGTYVGGKGSLYVNPPTGHGYVQVNAAAASEAGFAVQSAGAVKWFLYRPASGNDLRFFDATADRVTFAQGGNVGIGVTAPTALLQVGSNTQANQGIVSLTGDVRLPAYSGGVAYLQARDSVGSGNIDMQIRTQLAGATVDVMRITSGGNVGIGTTAPSAPLQLNANGNVRMLVTNSAGTIYSAQIHANSDGSGAFYGYDGTASNNINLYVGAGGLQQATGGVLGWTNSATNGLASLDTALMRNAAGVVEFNNGTLGQYRDIQIRSINPSSGNVGIGTTSPVAKLDIKPAADGDIGVTIGSTSVSGVLNSPANFYINSSAAGGNIIFGINRAAFTGGTEVMRLTSGGNVGIGTTSATSKLTVNGDISFANGAGIVSGWGSDLLLTAPSGNLNFVGQGQIPLRIFGNNSTSYAPFNFNTISSTNSYLGYYADYSGGGYRARSTAAGILEFNNGTWTLASDTGLTNLANFTPTVRFAVNSTGNVGIGVTAPTALLQVGSNTQANQGIVSLTGDVRLPAYSGGVAYLQARDSVGSGNIDMQIRTQLAGATVDVMRITSGGNVGIGTTNATQTLHVQGPAAGAPAVSGTTQNGILRLGQASGNGIVDFGINNAGSGWFQSTDKTNLSTNNTLSFNPNGGNVGIGTITPGAVLAITTAAATANALAITDATNYTLNAGYAASGVGYFGGNIGSALSLRANGTEAVRIITSGNVGIGTTTPAAKLELQGTDVAGAAYEEVLRLGKGQVSTAGDGSYISFVNGAAINAAIGGAHTGGNLGYLRFDTSNSGAGAQERMRIDGNGNVGIGTTSPVAALDVFGNITSPGSGSFSEKFGYGATASNTNATAVGRFANASGATGTALGTNSTSSGSGSVALGANALANAGNSIAIGSAAQAASGGFSDSIAIGASTSSTGANGIAIGGGATVSANNSIAIGRGAAATSSNTLVFGSGGWSLDNIYFGKGIVSTAPAVYAINGTGGSGTDIAGGNIAIAGGKATGNAAGGDILFQTSDIGATGATLQSLSTKVIVKASGNVGIGTTSPSGKLTVGGMGDGTQYYNIGPTAGYLGMSGSVFEFTGYYGGGAQPFGIYVDNSNIFRIAQKNQTASAVLSYSGSTSRWSAGILEAANFGATYSPSIVLDSASADETGFYRPAVNTIGFITDRTERMRIDANGNVGIGTTSPGANLDVSASGAGTLTLIKATNATTGITGSVQVGSSAALFSAGGGGFVAYPAADGHITITNSRTIFGSSDGIIASTGLDLKIKSEGGGSAGRSVILQGYNGSAWQDVVKLPNKASGNVDLQLVPNGGNVGIGTTAPAAKLEISSGATDNATPYVGTIWDGYAARVNGGNVSVFSSGGASSAGDSYQLSFYGRYFNTGQGYVTNKGGYVKGSVVSGATLNGQASGQGKLILGTSTTNYGTLAFSDVDTMTLTNGNVGIGTTAPSSALNVVGDTTVKGTGATGNNSLLVTDSSGNESFRVRGYGDASIAATLYLGGIGSSNYITAGALQIASNKPTGNTFFNLTHNNGNSALEIKSNADILLQQTAGNVGIGTTSPQGKLQVLYDATYGSSYGGLNVSNATTPTKIVEIGYDGSADIGYLQAAHVGTSNKNLILEPRGGNVGIGTTNPGYKLQVAGNVFINNGSELRTNSITDNGVANGITLNGSGIVTAAVTAYSRDGGIIFRARNSSNVDVLTVIDSGNVGIGTTAPVAKLHVTAGALATNGDAGLFVDAVTTSGASTIYGSKTNLTLATSSGGAGNIIAQHAAVTLSATTNLPTGIIGLGTSTSHTAASGALTQQIEWQSGPAVTSGGSTTSLYHAYLRDVFTSTGGTVGTQYGVYVNPFTTATNNVGIAIGEATGTKSVDLLIGTTTVPSGNFGIYNASTQPNYFAGNVGVGTTNPTAKFMVQSAAGGPSLVLTDNTYSTFAVTHSSGAIVNLFGTTGSQLALGSNNSEVIRINNFGNVGIGTTAPGSLLTVNGNTTIQNGGTLTLSGGSSSGQGNIQLGATASGGYDTNLVYLNSTAGTGGYMFGSTPSFTSGNGPYFGGRGNTYSAIANQRGNLFFSAGNPSTPGSTEGQIKFLSGADLLRMVIDNSGSVGLGGSITNAGTLAGANLVVQSAGNVGIGTSNPSALLQINGAISGTDVLVLRETTGGQNARMYFTTPIGTGPDLNISAGRVVLPSGRLNFTTGGTIELAGISGDHTITGSTSGITLKTNNIVLQSDNANTIVFSGGYNQDTIMRPYSNSYNVQIAPSGGNVGIGTTSPAQKLDVAGNMRFSTASSNVTFWGDGFVYASGDGALSLIGGKGATSPATDLLLGTTNTRTDGSILQVRNNGTGLMTVKYDGNVGIGTTSPGSKLEVSGPVKTGRLTADAEPQAGSGGAITVYPSSSASGVNRESVLTLNAYASNAAQAQQFIIRASHDTDTATITTSAAGGGANMPIIIQPGGASSGLYVGTSGNVGIGTTSPGSLLHVAGGIRTSNDVAGILTLGRMDNADEGAQIDWTGAGNGAGADWDNWATDIYQNSFRIFTNTANTNQVQIMNAGAGTAGLYVESNVGIGTTAPSQLLHVYRSTGGVVARFTDSDGSCDIDPTSTALVCSSDATLKKDISTLSGVLPKIQGMRGVSFKWKTQEDEALRIGVLAQEVEAVFPELVKTDTVTGKKSVNYTGLSPILLQAVKEQQDEISTLQNQIASLQGMNSLSSTTPITFHSHLYLSADSVGQAKILAGSTSVRVTFTKPYEQQPIVTATANGRVGSEYWVGEKDAAGFTLYIEAPAATDVTFDWHAFTSPEAKLTVSDGTTQQLTLVIHPSSPSGQASLAPTVLPPQPAPEDGPPAGEVAGESVGTDSDSNSDQTQSSQDENPSEPPNSSPTPTPDS